MKSPELLIGHALQIYLYAREMEDVATYQYRAMLFQLLDHYDIPRFATMSHQLAVETERDIEEVLGIKIP